MLCFDCEQLLNDRYEKYFKALWFDNKLLPKTLEFGSCLNISSLDYKKFKLFHLSVLYRASVSTLPEFKEVTLGPHEEKIREILWGDIFTPDGRYSILCHALIKNGSEIQYGLMTSPFKLRQPNGHLSYGFCFGGCVWYYVIDSRNMSKITNYMLNMDGKISITPISWENFLDS